MTSQILIIEDESSLADNAAIALRRDGLSSRHAPSLAAATRLLAEEQFALILLDLGLPDGSGLDFLRQMRRSSAIPVIILTARSDELDRILGLELGADDYVSKPFSPRELVARVKAVLRRCPSAPIAVAAKPLLRIDEERHEAEFAGKPLALTAAEFRLLACLAKDPGRVFSRSQLLLKAWGDAAAAEERTVDAHVKSLRAKLRELSPKECLATRRGFGYCWISD
ncbi:MAG: two-component system, response regulator [Verrucomicrobiota bacterium]|jgi:two-component system catabolic regulation response regulator CreB